MMAHWGLDPAVRSLVEDHHLPSNAEDRERAILHFSDALLASFGVGFREDVPTETPMCADALELLSDSPDFMIKCEERVLREAARAMTTVEALR